jgi:short-subunit dehydrogenase
MSKMMLTPLAETMRKELGEKGVHTGIIYVGGTENDPGKEVIQEDGGAGLLGEVNSWFIDSQDYVAGAVMWALKYRQFRTIIGIKGTMYYVLQKLVPGFVERALRFSMGLIRKYDK